MVIAIPPPFHVLIYINLADVVVACTMPLLSIGHVALPQFRYWPKPPTCCAPMVTRYGVTWIFINITQHIMFFSEPLKYNTQISKSYCKLKFFVNRVACRPLSNFEWKNANIRSDNLNVSEKRRDRHVVRLTAFLHP